VILYVWGDAIGEQAEMETVQTWVLRSVPARTNWKGSRRGIEQAGKGAAGFDAIHVARACPRDAIYLECQNADRQGTLNAKLKIYFAAPFPACSTH
jgi:hypothetical protein